MFKLYLYLLVIIYLFIYFCLTRTPRRTDGNGMGLRRESYPPLLPRYPCPISYPHPAPFSRGTFFPRPYPTRYPLRPNMNFHFFFSLFLSKLYEKKKKKSINMTTIDLLANRFSTNQFTSINLHETTIYA